MAKEKPAAQRQTAVIDYLRGKQLLLFVFARRSVCQYSMAEENPASQRQTAVTAYFLSEQLLLFVFARRSVCQYSMAEENPAAQRQTESSYCCFLGCFFYPIISEGRINGKL